MKKTPYITKGGLFNDERGCLRYVNAFTLDSIKRFYIIKHNDTSTIRAWQGHQFEEKSFYPIAGSFIIAWIKIDDFNYPSDDLIPEYHILSYKNSEIITIPKGYANGIKALEPNSELISFSNMDLEESKKENIRFNADLWFDWENLKPLKK